MLKKFLSLAMSIVIMLGCMSAVSVYAAGNEVVVLNLGFENDGTDTLDWSTLVNSGTTANSSGEYPTVSVVDYTASTGNDLTEHSALKFTFPDGGALSDTSNTHRNYFNSLQLPFTIPAGYDTFTVEFKTLCNSSWPYINWGHFGSIGNAEYTNGRTMNTANLIGHMVRSGSNTMSYLGVTGIAGYAGATLIGLKNKGFSDLSKDANNAGYTAIDTAIGDKWNTIKITVNTKEQTMNMAVNNVNHSNTVYMSHSLTQNQDGSQSGTINFWGHSEKYNDLPDVYIDDIKVTAMKDPTEIPTNLTFSSESDIDQMGVVIGEGRGDIESSSSATIEDEALKLTIHPMNSSDNDFGSTDQWWAIKNNFNTKMTRRYSGLKDGENLKISFKFKKSTAAQNVAWADFASLYNADGNKILYGYSAHQNNSGIMATGQLGTVGFFGYNADSIEAGSALSADNVSVHTISMSGTDWHTVTLLIDGETKKVTSIMDGTVIDTDLYLMNELTSSGYIYFNGYSKHSNTAKATTDQYFDDIKFEAYEPLTVTTDLTAENWDAAADINLTFNRALSDVTEAADIKANLTITETVGGTEKVVSPERISVELLNDKTSAKVTIDGGLKYGNKSYNFYLKAEGLQDNDFVALQQDYSFNFVTKFAAGIYADVSDIEVGATEATATLIVKNPTNADGIAVVILAVYNENNKLVGMDILENISVSKNGGVSDTINLEAPVIANETGVSAKLLLWNSLAELVPYHMAIEVSAE